MKEQLSARDHKFIYLALCEYAGRVLGDMKAQQIFDAHQIAYRQGWIEGRLECYISFRNDGSLSDEQVSACIEKDVKDGRIPRDVANEMLKTFYL